MYFLPTAKKSDLFTFLISVFILVCLNGARIKTAFGAPPGPSVRLTVHNNVLQWSDGVPVKIVEANSPETAFAFLDYEWLDWLNAVGVNTIYATVNGKETGQVHVFPWKDENDPSQGFDDPKVDAWVAFAQYWVNLGGGRKVLHIILSEAETHTLYTDSLQKAAMQYLVNKFQPVAGHIIWDREEIPAGSDAMINHLYGYLKSIDTVNLRGIHNESGENPWASFYNSDLIQFLSFQEDAGSFDNRIRTEVPKNPNWAGYASEMLGGFQPNDVSDAETIFNAGAPYNSGAGVFINCCDQRDTHDHWYQAYQPVYNRMAQLARNPTDAYEHIVILILENRSYSEIIGSAPYLTSLANNGANFTNSHFISRPSQPNYLALFSGSTQGVSDNLNHGKFNAPNLARSLLDAGKTFVGYYEDLPSAGYEGDQTGSYFRKHNPSIQFSNIPLAQTNVPYSTFPTDFSQLPTVAYVVPNNSHNMHDNSVSSGDTWINQHLSAYAQWAVNNNSLLIITFDEASETLQDNRIATIFYGAGITPAQYTNNINHYNVLRTIEEIYGLPYIANTAAASNVWDSPRLVEGCTDPAASNYNPNATVDDGSCLYDSTSSILIQYSTSSNHSNPQNLDGVTLLPGDYYVFAEPQSLSPPVSFYLSQNGVAVSGYNPNTENVYPYDLNGGAAFNFTTGNYSLRVTSGNQTAIANFTIGGGGAIPGCTDPAATNYNPNATVDDGSCQYGTSLIMIEYSTSSGLVNPASLDSATLSPGNYYVFAEPQNLSTPVRFYLSKNGVAVSGYNPKTENVYPYELDGGAPYNFTAGNYSLRVTSGNQTATANFTVGGNNDIPGCTDPAATNYNPNATVDDGSCQYGTASILIQYSISSNHSNPQNLDGVPLQPGDYYVFAEPQSLSTPVRFYLSKNGTPIPGYNPNSENVYPYDLNGGPAYNFTAGSYSLRVTSGNETATANFNISSGGSVPGCTDPAAINYNPNATVDDGSCQYSGGNGIVVKYTISPSHNNAMTLNQGDVIPPGNYYVFAEPQSLTTPVRFYLKENGSPVSYINPHSENYYPYDINGSSNYGFDPGNYELTVTSGSLSITLNFSAGGANKTGGEKITGDEPKPLSDNLNILSIYPNPFSEKLTIECRACTDIAEFKIFNANGKLLRNEIIKTESGANEKVIYFTPNLASGLYIVEVISGKHTVIRKIYKITDNK